MAATGKTPILLYGSTTATNAPVAGNLTNSSDGCEIAINVADKNLFFKDSTNAVNTVPIRQSSASSNGWLSSTDWSAFNSKQAALVSGTNIKTVNGTTLLGSGDLGTIGVAYGGTGLTSLTTSRIPYGNGTSAFNSSANLLFDGNNLVVGTPTARDVGTFAQSSSAGIGVEVSNLSTANNTTKYMRYVFSGYDTVGTYKQTGFIKNLPADANWTAASIAIETRTGDVTSEKARFWGSGGVSIGNTTDPGATNLSVSGTTTAASFIPTSSTAPTNGMYLRAANSLGWSTNSGYRMGLSATGQFGYNTSTFNTYFTIGGGSQQYSALATYPGTVQINDGYGVSTLQNNSGLEFVGSPFSAGYGNKISGFDGGQLVFGARNASATWAEGMRMTNDPYLLIGYTTSNGAYKLQVNSQIFATSSTIATSDGRYKEKVKPLENALELVSKLNPVQFNWKKHPVHEFDTSIPTVGFIAQEVQETLKSTDFVDSIVKKNTCTLKEADIDSKTRKILEPAVTEEFYGIAEGNMVALLTKALQELKQQFDDYVASHP